MQPSVRATILERKSASVTKRPRELIFHPQSPSFQFATFSTPMPPPSAPLRTYFLLVQESVLQLRLSRCHRRVALRGPIVLSPLELHALLLLPNSSFHPRRHMLGPWQSLGDPARGGDRASREKTFHSQVRCSTRQWHHLVVSGMVRSAFANLPQCVGPPAPLSLSLSSTGRGASCCRCRTRQGGSC